MMAEELKACPFCGMKESRYVEGLNGATILQCQWCGASHHSSADWNTRPIEDALLTRAEAAEAELAALREQTRWIPCSERMPEEGQEIYARERGGIITRFKYSNKLRDIFVRHYTHWNWMPLPPPPVTPD